MTRPIASLYRRIPADVEKRLTTSIDKGCTRTDKRPFVFFRADDIGIPSRNFSKMVAIFRKHNLPLCLATVPIWLNRDRLQRLVEQTGRSKNQWYWHQHGYIHHNFELTGKKQEFGPSRSEKEIVCSLTKGQKRLTSLLEDQFNAVFTPPWNRCSSATMKTLVKQGFAGISRSIGASPEAPSSLPDLQVGVDLHTRKEPSGELAFTNLLVELEKGFEGGLCGIMLHHQRMNTKAFHFLDILLSAVQNKKQSDIIHFGDILYEQQIVAATLPQDR